MGLKCKYCESNEFIDSDKEHSIIYNETESIRRSNIKRDSRILDLENDLAELRELAESLGIGMVNTFGNRIKP